MADIFPYLIVFTSPQERSAAPTPRTFDVTLHATKPRTLVKGSEYFCIHDYFFDRILETEQDYDITW